MKEKVISLKETIENYTVDNQEQLEAFRLRFISRKGELTTLFESLKTLPAEEKREAGQWLNSLKNTAQEKFKILIESLEQNKNQNSSQAHVDLTLPPADAAIGAIHPLTLVRNEMCRIFERIGFNISEGPEIEDDWHNFTALNFPENHPAREMQDTFFIEKHPDIALRTHTSSVQVRVMENQKPPIRTLSPGRVFRNEAISARAHCVFHQVEW